MYQRTSKHKLNTKQKPTTITNSRTQPTKPKYSKPSHQAQVHLYTYTSLPRPLVPLRALRIRGASVGVEAAASVMSNITASTSTDLAPGPVVIVCVSTRPSEPALALDGSVDETGPGSGAEAEWCRRGLKMSTTMSPKMMSRSRKMHCRRPVIFCYMHGMC